MIQISDSGGAVLFSCQASGSSGKRELLGNVRLRHGYYSLKIQGSHDKDIDILVMGTRGRIELLLQDSDVQVQGVGVYPLIYEE